MNTFKSITPEELTDNPFSMIGTRWMLVTAGTRDSFNTMTASWGGFGVLWNKPVAAIFVRPTRHTYGFLERQNGFTLCFFEEQFRGILNHCGRVSGRDTDKVKDTGLIPLTTDRGSVFFEQASIIIECEKIFYQDLDPANFLAPYIEPNYPRKDYHRMYLGEIINILRKGA